MVHLGVKVLVRLWPSCVLVRVVSHISSLPVPAFQALLARPTDRTFLVQVLNVEASTSLMATKASWRSSFQRLVLASSSSLSVQVLPQVVVWRLQLLYDVRCSAASSLEGHVAVRLIQVVDVVLIVHRLSVVLVLEYFGQNALCARGHR